MTPEEALKRAEKARQLFEDPFLQETLSTMEREIMEAWMTCPVRDIEGRETLWRMAVTTRKFRDMLRGTAESGKLAAQQIRERQSAAERLKQVFRR